MKGDYIGRLPDGTCVQVRVAAGRIAAILPHAAAQEPELVPYLLPVLVDLQHNGGLGHYYVDLGVEEEGAFNATADHLRRHGVGRAWLTLVTRAPEQLTAVAGRLSGWLAADRGLDTLYAGVFHEGTFISPCDGWRGAHPQAWIESPNYPRVRQLNALLGGRIRMVNVAPEEPGGLEFIDQAVADGMLVALGHCCPDRDTIYESVRRGASMVTHFGNGAAPLIHRFKNPFWAFLDIPELMLGLICDGHHLPPELVRTALRCKGRSACVPVSDASGYSALPAGDYAVPGGSDISIEANGFLHVRDSELLAGGWFQQDRCVEFLVRHADLSFIDAWHQCSLVPAAAGGLTLPRIEVGEEASFVLARWDDGVVIEQSVHHGTPYLDAPVRPADPAASQ